MNDESIDDEVQLRVARVNALYAENKELRREFEKGQSDAAYLGHLAEEEERLTRENAAMRQGYPPGVLPYRESDDVS